MAWDARWGLKRIGQRDMRSVGKGLNGLGCPLGIETNYGLVDTGAVGRRAKWLGMPVGD